MALVMFKDTISQPRRGLTQGAIEPSFHKRGGTIQIDGDEGTIDVQMTNEELKGLAVKINNRFAILAREKDYVPEKAAA